MKNILLFGAGKSSTCLIDYLIEEIKTQNWQLTIADNDLALIESKIGVDPPVSIKSVQINIEDEQERKKLVQTSDIIISLLPPSLHFVLAGDCLAFRKNLLTASY